MLIDCVEADDMIVWRKFELCPFASVPQSELVRCEFELLRRCRRFASRFPSVPPILAEQIDDKRS